MREFVRRIPPAPLQQVWRPLQTNTAGPLKQNQWRCSLEPHPQESERSLWQQVHLRSSDLGGRKEKKSEDNLLQVLVPELDYRRRRKEEERSLKFEYEV